MMWPPSRSTLRVRTIAPAARTANATAKTSDFFTEADHDKVSPRNTMKKKGPHKSQSRSAFPGSSLKGLGNTTNFKLLRILDKSLFTVSHTGSVRVLGAGPKPSEAMPCLVLTGSTEDDDAGGGGGGGCFW